MRKLLIGVLLAGFTATSSFADRAAEPQSNKAGANAHHPQGRSAPAPARSQPRAVERGAAGAGRAVHTAPPAASVTKARPSGARYPAPAHRPSSSGAPHNVVVTPVHPGPRVIEPRERHNPILPSERPAHPNARPAAPVISTVPRPRTEPPLRPQARPTPRPQWNTNWRHDNRYDWHNWRRDHHNRFHHQHHYIDPFGWGYFRYWVGWRLWPAYYGSQYWILDPWYYHLPPAPPGTHWVRYYNDLLLVDTWSGEVVDVIYDFFW
ncbi:MAG TPA: RcnB family protein [Sphingomicrobium sp.]|nr:RcnB family protein [Sphingomicrobium sp.]